MILKALSPLSQSPTHSILDSTSLLSPKGEGRGRNLVPVVILTSLIDAFSILVIYLLMNYSASGEMMYLREGMKLPKAMNSITLENSIVVQFHDGVFYINDKETKSLVADLISERKVLYKKAVDKENLEYALVVQSDKKVPYKYINKIVQASAHVGFDEVRFAVLKP